MEEWKEYKIEDTSIKMVDGDRGSNYPKNSDFHSKGFCLFLNAGNVTKNGFAFTDNSFIDKDKDNALRNGRLERNDVIITTRGTVGNVAFYDSKVPYENVRINSGMLILKSGDAILPEYLYYYLKGNVFQSQLTQFVSGSAQPQLPKSTLGKMSISYPVLKDTQFKIVKILKSLDDKIEINKRINDNLPFLMLTTSLFILWLLKRINDNLEQQAKTLFKAWFVNYEPFKNGAFVDSELGLIPEGWSVKQLGDITTQQTDKVKNRSDVKVLSPITTGKLVLSEEYFTKQVFSESISKYIVVKPLDFAYNPARVNIGSMGMNEFDFDGCVSPVYVVFRCENEYQYYFDLFRQTDIFNEEVKTRAIGGVRQSLTYKDFSLIKTVYPPIEVVREFNQIYSKIISQIKNNNEAIECLASIRDELLPKLMTGEIKVDNIVM